MIAHTGKAGLRHLHANAVDLSLLDVELLESLLVNSWYCRLAGDGRAGCMETTFRYTSLDSAIDGQMGRIRREIDDPLDVKLLHTVRGVGFCAEDDPGGVVAYTAHIYSNPLNTVVYRYL